MNGKTKALRVDGYGVVAVVVSPDEEVGTDAARLRLRLRLGASSVADHVGISAGL